MSRPPRSRLVVSAAGLTVLGLTLTACNPAEETDDGVFSVVASTSVYGDIVKAIAPEDVEITSVIDNPAQDPHSYEATPQDQLLVAKADLVVVNGGGYDSYMTRMLEAVDSPPTVIDAVQTSELPDKPEPEEPHAGHAHDEDEAAGSAASAGATEEHADDAHAGHDHGEFNEHVWFSLPTMELVADSIAHELSEGLPEQTTEIEANHDEFVTGLSDLMDREDAIAAEHGGTNVAVTEPVPLRMFDDMDLHNVIDERFLAAVEEGSDVSPQLLQSAIESVHADDVALLANNPLTEGPQTEKLTEAAEEESIPVLEMSELLPEGTGYLDWVDGYVTDVEEALA